MSSPLNDWFFYGLAQSIVDMVPIPIDRVRTHGPDECADEVCSIHNPSDHVMISYPQVWRPDRGIVERVCPHGVGHPDPDDFKVRHNPTEAVHGCDGCCETEANP